MVAFSDYNFLYLLLVSLCFRYFVLVSLYFRYIVLVSFYLRHISLAICASLEVAEISGVANGVGGAAMLGLLGVEVRSYTI